MESSDVSEVIESVDGVLLIDKPRGLSSHDVVDRIRKVAGTRRVGHTGTLDPMAEGLLVICIGAATKVSQFLTGLVKEYTGVIKLGAISSTYDAEGSIMAQQQPVPRDRSEVESAMQAQVGLRTQLAPPFSAVKVRGKKLYEYARAGLEVPEKHRRVQIYRFELLDYNPPEIRFRARVASGTYIRSMAHDLGIHLGCGAFLSNLRRESVGDLRVENSLPLHLLVQSPLMLRERLLEIADALIHLQKISISPSAEEGLLHGRGFTTRDIVGCENIPRLADQLLVLNHQGKALSIVTAETSSSDSENESATGIDSLFFRPLRVLNTD